jgi:GNAT superfamily N-acetyltransferase
MGMKVFSPKTTGPKWDQYLKETKEVFFSTSITKEFKDEVEREGHYERWLGQYIELYPEYFYIAYDERVLGYLVACPDSQESLSQLNIKSLELFKAYFNDFPVHFHINIHPKGQGKGTGRLLIDTFLKTINGQGVHIITSPDAGNKSFYRKLGFLFEKEGQFNQNTVLFMGRK